MTTISHGGVGIPGVGVGIPGVGMPGVGSTPGCLPPICAVCCQADHPGDSCTEAEHQTREAAEAGRQAWAPHQSPSDTE